MNAQTPPDETEIDAVLYDVAIPRGDEPVDRANLSESRRQVARLVDEFVDWLRALPNSPDAAPDRIRINFADAIGCRTSDISLMREETLDRSLFVLAFVKDSFELVEETAECRTTWSGAIHFLEVIRAYLAAAYGEDSSGLDAASLIGRVGKLLVGRDYPMARKEARSFGNELRLRRPDVSLAPVAKSGLSSQTRQDLVDLADLEVVKFDGSLDTLLAEVGVNDDEMRALCAEVKRRKQELAPDSLKGAAAANSGSVKFPADLVGTPVLPAEQIHRMLIVNAVRDFVRRWQYVSVENLAAIRGSAAADIQQAIDRGEILQVGIGDERAIPLWQFDMQLGSFASQLGNALADMSIDEVDSFMNAENPDLLDRDGPTNPKKFLEHGGSVSAVVQQLL